MRTKIMKELVIEEANNLRNNATKEELSRLDFSNLNSQNSETCIYGQMTGYCFSKRANELIINSCKRVYIHDDADIYKSKLNGKPTKNRDDYWSPIEVFIDQDINKKNGNNELLVKFLKGEINELKFK